MRYIYLISLTFLIVSLSQAQTQEELKAKGYVPCSHEHTDPNEACYVLMPTEDEVRNHSVEMRSQSSCRLRPLRILIPYDREIENDYTPAEIDSMILQNASKLDTAFQNSNIEYAGIEYIIVPWDMPEYESIYDLSSMVRNPNDSKLDYLNEFKNSLADIDILLLIASVETNGRGVATQLTSTYTNWEKAVGVVNFGEILLNSIVVVHEIGHMLGGGHEFAKGNGTDSNARAYVNDSLKTHSAIFSANRLSREVPVFSGPNSWAYTQQGVYHRFYEDTSTNNAYYVQLLHDEYMCANPVTFVEIDTPLCGSGELRAITNNADSFIWQVVSGNIDLQAENDTLVDYIAHEESVVRVIGQKTGKLYADTAYMTVPARQQIQIDTTMTQGDTLSDGTIVTQSGTYVVTELDENGCEVIITYNVELSTSVTSFHEAGISLYPNPANDQIHLSVNNLEYEILNVAGQAVKSGMMEDYGIRIQDLSPGMYFLQVHKDLGVYQARFVKE